jgi:hypothetical protein
VPPPSDEETNVDGAAAHNDRLGVGESSAVNGHGEVTLGQTRERPVNAAEKFVVRSARTDRFANGQRDEFPHAQRRCKRKGGRPVCSDGMEIERHPHANHTTHFLLLRGAACRRG